MKTGLLWRPHTEKPDEFPNSLLIAYPADSEDPEDRACLGAAPYRYTKEDGFLDEEYDEPPYAPVFFWCYEREVVAGVPSMIEAEALLADGWEPDETHPANAVTFQPATLNFPTGSLGEAVEDQEWLS